MQEEDAVRAAFHAINNAWLQRRAQDMREHLHPDVVMVQPGFGAALRGREECIASYADFRAGATLHAYTSTPPTVQVWADTAVAWHRWTMRYEWDGHLYDDAGHEVFVFGRADGRWVAVWRTLISGPAAG
jgi:uncharacterized protein (TIGR02246 family)